MESYCSRLCYRTVGDSMGNLFTSAFGVNPGATGDDAALVRSARADTVVFGELYKRHLPRIYSYLRARTDSDEDAADLSQQVFLKALDALPRYEERGTPFAAWLFRIASNVASDARRRARPSTFWDQLPEWLHPADPEGPEAAAIRGETREAVRTLLGDLDPEARELLVLRFVGGLTLREIAAVVGKKESAVHKQLVRTLRKLEGKYDARG